MNFKKISFFLALTFIASSAYAEGPRSLTPVDGTYVPMTSTKFNAGEWDGAPVYAGPENGKVTYVCAGNGSAKTPGKLINGNCYYANNGDEHRNKSYYMLAGEDRRGEKLYKWKSAKFINSGASAITSRDWDAGDYIYHCIAYPKGSRNTYAGKYLPGTGKCYWSYYGDEKSTSDTWDFSILVPNTNY